MLKSAGVTIDKYGVAWYYIHKSYGKPCKPGKGVTTCKGCRAFFIVSDPIYIGRVGVIVIVCCNEKNLVLCCSLYKSYLFSFNCVDGTESRENVGRHRKDKK